MDRAFRYYRAMAYVTGTTLILLFITLALHAWDVHLWHQIHWFVALIGVGHGVVLYPIYMVTCFNLILKAKIPPVYFILMLVAGFVPLLAFIMERYMARHLIARGS
jgi:integral membrane protein